MVRISIGNNDVPVTRTEKGQSILAFPNSYTVIDLETTGLDPRYDSIIEVAAARVQDDNIVAEYSSLVNPGYSLDPYITELTGITDEMLKDAPSLNSVLPAFLDFIGSSVIVGHNVNFDINFIYDACIDLLGKPFVNDFVDTLRISRRLYPDMKHHRLGDMVLRFRIIGGVDHRALSDVQKTQACFLKMKQDAALQNIDISKKRSDLRASDIHATTTDFDEDSPIYNKKFVFTGALSALTRAEAMQIVVDHGGSCADSVSKSVDYLVIGNLDYAANIKDGKSNKQKKAEQLKLKGNPIEVISESVFQDMINH